MSRKAEGKTPAQQLAHWTAWCKANRARVNATNRRSYQRLRIKRLEEKRKYFADNKDAILARRRANIQCVLANRLRWQIWRALNRRYARKDAALVELIGCSLTELRVHIESRFCDGMTWDNRRLWHIDHIRPIASFDLTDRVQLLACWHYSNLRPLWARENHQKGAKWNGDEIR